MPRRQRWTPTLQKTGSLAEAVAAFEAGLPAVATAWNIHVDRFLRYAACCHAQLGQPSQARALLEAVREAGERLIGLGELSAFLARAGHTALARQCAEEAEAMLDSMGPSEGVTTYREAPLGAAWALLGEGARARRHFAAAEKGLANPHNHSGKVRTLLRALMVCGDYTVGTRVLDAHGQDDAYAIKGFVEGLIDHDVDAGLALLRATTGGRSDRAMRRMLAALTAAGRFDAAWEGLELFTNLYRLPLQLTLLRDMIAAGQREAAIARMEAQLAALADQSYPVSGPAWVELLSEHAPEKAAHHESSIALSLTIRTSKAMDSREEPLVRLRIAQGRLGEALALVESLRAPLDQIALLSVICRACHDRGTSPAEALARLTAKAVARTLEAAPPERLAIALRMTETLHHLGDTEARERALDEVFACADACPPKEKRFRYAHVMLECDRAGLPDAAYRALQKMPSGSQKYEAYQLAQRWVDRGYIRDAIALVSHVPSRGEDSFRTLERSFNLLQYVFDATHPGMGVLMPN